MVNLIPTKYGDGPYWLTVNDVDDKVRVSVIDDNGEGNFVLLTPAKVAIVIDHLQEFLMSHKQL